jgi:hypothetical protein
MSLSGMITRLLPQPQKEKPVQIPVWELTGGDVVGSFFRNNYTSDSNAMMTGFLRDFADAEEAVGNTSGAASLRALSVSMTTAINAKLWASSGVVSDAFRTPLLLNEQGKAHVSLSNPPRAVVETIIT